MNKMAFIIIVALLFCSCSNKTEKTIEGWWTIDTIYYGDYDVRECLLSNSLNFYKNECNFPISKGYCRGVIETYEEDGTWNVFHTDTVPLIMVINSDNKMFAGQYRLIFRADEKNKLLKMEISSDSLYIICRKGLFDFDRNKKTINDLVNLSNVNR